jgi:hypothetical protein
MNPVELMQIFEVGGEAARRQLSVDGIEDAQDKPHEFVEFEWLPCCLACGLVRKAAVHQ